MKRRSSLGRQENRWRPVNLAAAGYSTYVGLTWYRYGHPRYASRGRKNDPLLDQFMPAYEVAKCQWARVAASADITLAAACDQDLQQSNIVRAIFKGRELILGSEPEKNALPRGLLAQVKALGWGMLAEIPGREIVMGAVTRPWEANVVFRALPPDAFATFGSPAT